MITAAEVLRRKVKADHRIEIVRREFEAHLIEMAAKWPVIVFQDIERRRAIREFHAKVPE